MSDDIKNVTENLQNSIREVAYLMWEAAGRQQGLAMDYWLAAERIVMETLNAATAAATGQMQPKRGRGAGPAAKEGK